MKKKRILALAMALCMSLMLAACGSTPTNSDPADTGSGDDEVSTTKTLTMAIAAETTTLSPLYMGNANMCTDMLVYENLVNYENGEIVPGLAERWEFSDDGCTLTFYLLFHFIGIYLFTLKPILAISLLVVFLPTLSAI